MPIRKQDSSVFDNFELRLNESSKKFLRETSQWAFVLSMIGFVLSGFLLFVGIFSLIFFNDAATVLSNLSELPPYAYSIIYMLIAVVSFFPALYLYSFSRRMKTALLEKDTDDLTKAFSKLKLYFKFLTLAIFCVIAAAILTILFLVLLSNS
ncbi:DUF5362 family protein [Kordia sp.]|uniref:DUF5362 family protein n=1 Tax=Kordia sp. TaxID=1965332 RepID=UPI0025BA8725|nr:DUF5362 family protein [Kordia sp.]MCH2194366.1 DUF5362 family protein [Kordia sp.]